MGIDQKRRSLYGRLQSGLNFQELDGEWVIFLLDMPFEWEDIIAQWICALPGDYADDGSLSFLRNHPQKGLALTEMGWNAFIGWMNQTLHEAQRRSDFPDQVKPHCTD